MVKDFEALVSDYLEKKKAIKRFLQENQGDASEEVLRQVESMQRALRVPMIEIGFNLGELNRGAPMKAWNLTDLGDKLTVDDGKKLHSLWVKIEDFPPFEFIERLEKDPTAFLAENAKSFREAADLVLEFVEYILSRPGLVDEFKKCLVATEMQTLQ